MICFPPTMTDTPDACWFPALIAKDYAHERKEEESRKREREDGEDSLNKRCGHILQADNTAMSH